MTVDSALYQVFIVVLGLTSLYALVVSIVTAISISMALKEQKNPTCRSLMRSQILVRGLMAGALALSYVSWSFAVEVVWDPTVYVFPLIFVAIAETFRHMPRCPAC